MSTQILHYTVQKACKMSDQFTGRKLPFWLEDKKKYHISKKIIVNKQPLTGMAKNYKIFKSVIN